MTTETSGAIEKGSEKAEPESLLAWSSGKLHREISPFEELCGESADDVSFTVSKPVIAHPLKG